jgi:hypothetical protein
MDLQNHGIGETSDKFTFEVDSEQIVSAVLVETSPESLVRELGKFNFNLGKMKLLNYLKSSLMGMMNIFLDGNISQFECP